MNLKQYQLTDWDWIAHAKDKYGTHYYDFVDKVCVLLNRLKPGYFYNLADLLYEKSEIFNIKYTDSEGREKVNQDVDLFIKICCMWILTNMDYSFSNDFTKIKRDNG